MSAPTILLNAAAVARTVRRMAEEVVELFDGTDGLVLVGIQRRGVQLAQRIAAVIEATEQVTVPRGALDITLYRDDLQTVMGFLRTQDFGCELKFGNYRG